MRGSGRLLLLVGMVFLAAAGMRYMLAIQREGRGRPISGPTAVSPPGPTAWEEAGDAEMVRPTAAPDGSGRAGVRRRPAPAVAHPPRPSAPSTLRLRRPPPRATAPPPPPPEPTTTVPPSLRRTDTPGSGAGAADVGAEAAEPKADGPGMGSGRAAGSEVADDRTGETVPPPFLQVTTVQEVVERRPPPRFTPPVLLTPMTSYPGEGYAVVLDRTAISPEIRTLAAEGTVVVRLLVLADGSVGRSEVVSSSGHPVLDQAALSASLGWRFRPATRDGRPIDAWAIVPVRFVVP